MGITAFYLQRTGGPKQQWKPERIGFKKKEEYDNPRDQAKSEAYKYLRKKKASNKGIMAGVVYSSIDGLDDEILKDPQLAAGLVLLIVAETLPFNLVPTMGVEVPENYMETKMKEGIDKIANFFGRDDNYKSALEAEYKKDKPSN